jgi:hypothetical protein
VLFEIAPIHDLRAELAVDERDVHELKAGKQSGELAVDAKPGQHVSIRLVSVRPVAEVVEGSNVFKARAELLQTYPWMRPGMEGTARVLIDRRHVAWIWTHRLVDWFRLKLWI